MTQPEIFTAQVRELSPGFNVRRCLPQKGLRRIGAWAFLDSLGPVSYQSGHGMHVHSHPHIGLQTFSWMIAGEITHHDSLGNHTVIRADEINLMTAGRGIAHVEISQDEGFVHAVQLWIALPEGRQNMNPDFRHYDNLPVWSENGLRQTLLVGEWCGRSSVVEVFSPLVGVDMAAQDECERVYELRDDFEYGVLPLDGEVVVNGRRLTVGMTAYFPTESKNIIINMPAGTRALLVGGEPMDENLIVWWNLIARSQEEIEQARAEWEEQSDRFGPHLNELGDWLHAPEITGKLRASGGKE